jgi:hypothetical protein
LARKLVFGLEPFDDSQDNQDDADDGRAEGDFEAAYVEHGSILPARG